MTGNAINAKSEALELRELSPEELSPEELDAVSGGVDYIIKEDQKQLEQMKMFAQALETLGRV
jgi:hypothetical protein